MLFRHLQETTSLPSTLASQHAQHQTKASSFYQLHLLPFNSKHTYNSYECDTFFFFFLWVCSPLRTLASLTILPQIFQTRAFFYHVSIVNNFTCLKMLSSHLHFGLPFFLEPSGCKKVIFCKVSFPPF
jgi:hypothetical protein